MARKDPGIEHEEAMKIWSGGQRLVADASAIPSVPRHDR
jgi:hypothetical protein